MSAQTPATRHPAVSPAPAYALTVQRISQPGAVLLVARRPGDSALMPAASVQLPADLAPLIAASVNAFARAGAELGVDAAELAGALDLAGLIRAARKCLSWAETYRRETGTGEGGPLAADIAEARAALAPLSALPCQPGAAR